MVFVVLRVCGLIAVWVGFEWLFLLCGVLLFCICRVIGLFYGVLDFVGCVWVVGM